MHREPQEMKKACTCPNISEGAQRQSPRMSDHDVSLNKFTFLAMPLVLVVVISMAMVMVMAMVVPMVTMVASG